jgi:hypothetical protein
MSQLNSTLLSSEVLKAMNINIVDFSTQMITFILKMMTSDYLKTLVALYNNTQCYNPGG